VTVPDTAACPEGARETEAEDIGVPDGIAGAPACGASISKPPISSSATATAIREITFGFMILV
jgi:hypothetical protein